MSFQTLVLFSWYLNCYLLKAKFEVGQEDSASAGTVQSTLEIGKDDAVSPVKKTVQDEVDILVDAIQLR